MTEATAYIGQPLRRREDLRLTTGKGRYVDDIKVPGATHMAVLRSPHAHAIISHVDLAAASAAPGVRLALSGSDLVGRIGPIVPNWIIPAPKSRNGLSLPLTACALSANAWRWSWREPRPWPTTPSV
jgi:carbon-monoxide dehydrogenase large subunit